MKKVTMILLGILFFILPTEVFAQRKVPILIYHSIDEFKGQGSKELYVTPENFEKQMVYLRDHGYTLLTFERWNDIYKVSKPIFITFDDGYKNNLNAYAIFQKLNTQRFKPTATVFVISDFIGRSNRLLKSDLKMMSDSGLISIQSHTATHPELTKIKNFDYELKVSKDKIQHITGKTVIALSYPYGNFNDQVVEETKKYYLFGLTTTPEPFSEKGIIDERYLLPRIYIKYSTNLDDFAKIVEGEHNKVITSHLVPTIEEKQELELGQIVVPSIISIKKRRLKKPSLSINNFTAFNIKTLTSNVLYVLNDANLLLS